MTGFNVFTKFEGGGRTFWMTLDDQTGGKTHQICVILPNFTFAKFGVLVMKKKQFEYTHH